MACDWEGFEPVEYPTFGHAEDNYEDVVRPFYRVWINFSTKKTFSWRDAYRSADAPDRATRRLMEKENKRFRDEGIREFNDAVRSLVAFVRKRDPRYIPNSQTEADRQKILRDAAAAQAARSRAANQAKLKEHVIPSWAQSQVPEDILSVSGSEESEVEHIECVVCGKTFKSEKQYETHEKSKKHIKAVQRLQREMRKENELLELNTPPNDEPGVPISGFDELSLQKTARSEADQPPPGIEKDPPGAGLAPGKHSDHDPHSIADDQSDSSEPDDEYASRKEVGERIKSSLAKKLASDDPNDSTATASVASDEWGQRKVGKAKAKRAKKAARQEKETQECQEVSL
jgi:DnaJ family protein A protein 5